MKNFNNKQTLQIVLLVVIAVVTLGVGYAAISAVNLIINGNATASVDQNNFKVHFIQAQSITGTTGVGGISIIDSDDTKASFNVTGLTKVGDYAEAKYVVKNDSNGIGAEITLELTNSNNEYFRVTETIDDNKLQAGDTTLATVKVEMTKTPINSDVSTSVTATLTASPLENSSATGGDSTSKASDDPVSFATDSWTIIQAAVRNNNTSVYNVGDTKTVTINNKNYMVRLVNKTASENCENENYSETACGFVVEFVDIVEKRKMNPSTIDYPYGTNIGGWPGSELYTYLQGSFYNSLPSELKSAIKPTRVISGYGNNGIDSVNFTSIDNLYLLSGVEIYGTDQKDKSAGTTHQLEYYQGMEADTTTPWNVPSYSRAYKGYNGSNGSREAWWLRSVGSKYDNDFRAVYYGILGCYYAFHSIGLVPVFRIG